MNSRSLQIQPLLNRMHNLSIIDRHFDGFYKDELAAWYNNRFGTRSCLNRSIAALSKDILNNLKMEFPNMPQNVQNFCMKLIRKFHTERFSFGEILRLFKFERHSFNLFKEWLPCDLFRTWHFQDDDLIHKVESNTTWVKLSEEGSEYRQFTRKGFKGRKTAMLCLPWYPSNVTTLVPASVAILSLFVLSTNSQLQIVGNMSNLDVTGGVITPLPIYVSEVKDDHLSLLSLANLIYAGVQCDDNALKQLDNYFVPFEYKLKSGKITYKESKDWKSLMTALKTSLKS